MKEKVYKIYFNIKLARLDADSTIQIGKYQALSNEIKEKKR